ncbi:MAG TPA: hypothetical protein VGR35_17050 [Tepidisphaeraceae bacterium]|nr:hypothetical protein [Tepidisphaeraceae bacterium]
MSRPQRRISWIATGALTFTLAAAPVTAQQQPSTAPAANQPRGAARSQTPPDAGSRAGAQDELLSMEQIRQAYEQGHYRKALQQSARALQIRDSAAAAKYDSYELQVIRGGSLLQLGDPVTALQAFESAAQSREPEQVGEARASALLIRRSTERKYKPRGKPDAEPIDIVDRASRRKAAAALLEDELARLQDELDAARTASTLVPILDVVEPMLDLRSLEYLATGGKGERTQKIAAEINERARELILREVEMIEERVAQMEEMASRIQNDGGGSVYRRGLISTERESLRNTITYLDRIVRTARDAQRMARMQGADGEAWEPVVDQALRTRNYAQTVLVME